MTTGRKEWKETGEELGGAFINLAKSLVRTGAAGVKEAEAWAEGDESEKTEASQDTQESTVFNDGTWRKTGKDLGKAFRSLGGSIMGSIERGADKAEEWAGDAKEAVNDTVEEAAQRAEKAADGFKHNAEEFAEGLKEADAEAEAARENAAAEEKAVVAEAEIVSEEIIEDTKE